MAEILLADDERLLRLAMKDFFLANGFAVRLAKNGEEAVKEFVSAKPDVVLMDVGMPKMNGIAAGQQIRQLDPLVPILFFTGLPSELAELRALGIGGDDYIEKTIGPERILSRVRRAVERARAVQQVHQPETILQLPRAQVDFNRRRVDFDDGETETLTETENSILRLLAANRGRYFSVDEIYERIRDKGDYVGEANTLRSHVSHLKAKLHAAGEMIVSMRFAGYKLVE